MWFTGIEGVNTSAGGCEWSALEGAVAERFFTSVVPDRTRTGVVWATTGNGGGEANPVLRSDDGGLSFADSVLLAPEARLRSLGVADDGRVWAQGMLGTEVWVWTSLDGQAWDGTAVAEVDRGAGLGDVGPDGSAWVITLSGGERVWRVTPQLEVGLVFESLEPIDEVGANRPPMRSRSEGAHCRCAGRWMRAVPGSRSTMRPRSAASSVTRAVAGCVRTLGGRNGPRAR